MQITIAHISTDYRALNYVSDSLMNDDVSQEVIQAKALLSELAATVSLPVETLALVTTRRFEDVEECVTQQNRPDYRRAPQPSAGGHGLALARIYQPFNGGRAN